MAFSWCGLGLTARGWFGLFGAVGVGVYRPRDRWRPFDAGSSVGHYDAR